MRGSKKKKSPVGPEEYFFVFYGRGGGPRSIFANFTIYINLRSLNLIVVPPSRPSRFSHGISISNEIRHYLHSISCADPPKNFQWVKIPREEFFFFDGGDVRGPFSVTVLFKNLRNLHLIVVSAAPPPPGLLDFRMVLTLPRSHISRASVICVLFMLSKDVSESMEDELVVIPLKWLVFLFHTFFRKKKKKKHFFLAQ